jgi:polar amino acid transport system substrate-binding protein
VKKILLPILAVGIFWGGGCSSTPKTVSYDYKDYQIVTENYPPLSFMIEDKVAGCSTEIVQEIMKRNNINLPIALKPWDMAYQEALKNPNTIIYSIDKSPAREGSFKWVGPIAQDTSFLYARVDSDVSIKDLNDAKQYSICVYKDDTIQQYLYREGFRTLVLAEDNKDMSRMLMTGKVQLWAIGELAVKRLAWQGESNPEQMKKVFKIRNNDLFIGFYKDTPDKIVSQFQATLDDMKKDGSYKKIIDRYDLKLK